METHLFRSQKVKGQGHESQQFIAGAGIRILVSSSS